LHSAHDWDCSGIPADLAVSTAGMFGMSSGFSATIAGQSTRMAPRRIATMSGAMIALRNDPITTAFYTFKIDLAPRNVAVEIVPHGAAVRR
jgi:hypothetical protein